MDTFSKYFSKIILAILMLPTSLVAENNLDQYKFEKDKIPSELQQKNDNFQSSGNTEPKVDSTKFLKRFLGTWIGDIHLSTMDGLKIRSFEVEQQYWWDDVKDTLEGLSVFEIEGEIQYAQSTHYIENDVIFTRVKEGESYKTYKGRIKGDSIIWYPMDKRVALDHQLTETFIMTDKGMAIGKDGFERLQYKGLDTMLLLKGELYLNE